MGRELGLQDDQCGGPIALRAIVVPLGGQGFFDLVFWDEGTRNGVSVSTMRCARIVGSGTLREGKRGDASRSGRSGHRFADGRRGFLS